MGKRAGSIINHITWFQTAITQRKPFLDSDVQKGSRNNFPYVWTLQWWGDVSHAIIIRIDWCEPVDGLGDGGDERRGMFKRGYSGVFDADLIKNAG